jgi:hypothetical protein
MKKNKMVCKISDYIQYNIKMNIRTIYCGCELNLSDLNEGIKFVTTMIEQSWCSITGSDYPNSRLSVQVSL